MVAFVVDDVPPPPPWRPRGIEIRGRGQALSSGGTAIMADFDDELIRIAPSRIISWGIEAGGTRRYARDVRYSWKRGIAAVAFTDWPAMMPALGSVRAWRAPARSRSTRERP